MDRQTSQKDTEKADKMDRQTRQKDRQTERNEGTKKKGSRGKERNLWKTVISDLFSSPYLSRQRIFTWHWILHYGGRGGGVLGLLIGKTCCIPHQKGSFSWLHFLAKVPFFAMFTVRMMLGSQLHSDWRNLELYNDTTIHYLLLQIHDHCSY